MYFYEKNEDIIIFNRKIVFLIYWLNIRQLEHLPYMRWFREQVMMKLNPRYIKIVRDDVLTREHPCRTFYRHGRV